MIAAFLARIGLQVLAPFVLPGLAYLVLGGGIAGIAWWNELADMPTALLGALSGVLFLASLLTSSISTRLALGLVALILGFLAGVINEQGRTEVKLNDLTTRHDLDIAKLNDGYRVKTEIEKQRQADINKRAIEAAAKAREELVAERQRLADERNKLLKEAADDKDADRPALGVDAVDRINRLRHDAPVRKRAPGTNGPGRSKPAA